MSFAGINFDENSYESIKKTIHLFSSISNRFAKRWGNGAYDCVIRRNNCPKLCLFLVGGALTCRVYNMDKKRKEKKNMRRMTTKCNMR